jgi:ribosome biogenesis GTPase A
MVRAMRLLEEQLALVDVVIEVRDARLPMSSGNPDLQRIVGDRPRLVVLARDDLADPFATRRWLTWFASHDRPAIAVDARIQPSVNRARADLEQLLAGRGPSRAMIIGVPNTGKSSLINGLAKRAAAKTENRAGVTRQLRWFRVSPQLELMDTPGILVPKIPTETAMWQLALTGALPRERYDAEEVIHHFVTWAAAHAPKLAVPDLATFARERGFVRRGDEPDLHNAAGAFLRAFNEGKLGRVTFEEPA